MHLLWLLSLSSFIAFQPQRPPFVPYVPRTCYYLKSFLSIQNVLLQISSVPSFIFFRSLLKSHLLNEIPCLQLLNSTFLTPNSYLLYCFVCQFFYFLFGIPSQHMSFPYIQSFIVVRSQWVELCLFLFPCSFLYVLQVSNLYHFPSP